MPGSSNGDGGPGHSILEQWVSSRTQFDVRRETETQCLRFVRQAQRWQRVHMQI